MKLRLITLIFTNSNAMTIINYLFSEATLN